MKRFDIVRLLFPLAVCLLLLTSAHAAGPNTDSELPAGTRKMADILARVIGAIEPLQDPYDSRARVQQMRASMAEAVDFHKELRIRLDLARELLASGDSEGSVHELEQVRIFAAERGERLSPRFEKHVRDQLAISYLRLGEQQNCLANHTIDSCVVPIKGGGIHVLPCGSRSALVELTAALEKDPEDLISRWLLNIAYMTLGEYPDKVPPEHLIPEKVFASDYDIGRFFDRAPSLGLDVMGLAGGSIMEDFDGDGFLDIMASSSGMQDPLRYFRSNGDGTFTDLTESAGLLPEIKSLNIMHADYDNDGDPDVYLLRGAWMHRQGRYPNSLLRNNGDNTFEDVTEEAGLLSFHPTQNAVWGDYDNDGWIDLFIGNESDANDKHPCELLHNNGDGTFTHMASSVGLNVVGFVKGSAWGDYNNDGLQDLYVTRLSQPNLLFRNDGPVVQPNGTRGWKFTDVTREAGVAEPRKAFVPWFWDYDNDGWLDLFVAAYHRETLDDIPKLYLGLPCNVERHHLYRNNGDGTFEDVSREARLDQVLLTMAANFGDLDNDDWLDCFFGTGQPDFRALLPNRMLRNAAGEFFQDVTTSGGFGNIQKGHAMAFGDLDNDGDQDIYQVLGGALPGDAYTNSLFENPGHGNHWLTLKLDGVRSNRAAIGVRIRVRLETEAGVRDLYRTVGTGGSFGGNSLQEEIGLGKASAIREVEITWPASATVQRFLGLEMDHAYRIREGEASAVPMHLISFDLAGAGESGHPPAHQHAEKAGDQVRLREQEKEP